MEKFKIYNLGGSCCQRRTEIVNERKIFIKEIEKGVEGVDNGFVKFFYEIEHMKKYQKTKLFPEILFVENSEKKYSVGMEFCYGGATLSDLLRNECVDMEYFKESFSFIMSEIFDKLYSNIFYDIPNSKYLNRCYYERVERRINHTFDKKLIEKYSFSDTLYNMFTKGCIINGDYYPPIFQYLSFMRNNNYLFEILMIDHVCNVHYDLCPLNILVETDWANKRIRNFKLIDVRGEGETGRDIRHYMYDMGKMLLGLDSFDLFRIFNGKVEERSYLLKKHEGKIPEFEFGFLDKDIVFRYKMAYEYFWKLMDENNYYSKVVGGNPIKMRAQFLFSQSMMYHPDIPCRIIYEHDEEMVILFYLRGMMMIRNFLEEVLGEDPVGRFNSKINLWNIVIER